MVLYCILLLYIYYYYILYIIILYYILSYTILFSSSDLSSVLLFLSSSPNISSSSSSPILLPNIHSILVDVSIYLLILSQSNIQFSSFNLNGLNINHLIKDSFLSSFTTIVQMTSHYLIFLGSHRWSSPGYLCSFT